MTRQAVMNVCTESERFCVHFSKVNKEPYDITTLESVSDKKYFKILVRDLVWK